MQNELPEWAVKMAEQVAKEATRDAMRDPLMPYYVTVAPHIARALVASERRGIERAAECVDALTTDDLPEDFIGHAASFGDVIDLAVAAIRQIGGEG